MPESPEVQALADDLGRRLAGREIRGVDVLEFRVTKTRARPLESLIGRRVAGVTRRGKLLDFALDDDAHFVVSLGRHGWARMPAMCCISRRFLTGTGSCCSGTTSLCLTACPNCWDESLTPSA